MVIIVLFKLIKWQAWIIPVVILAIIWLCGPLVRRLRERRRKRG